MKNKIAILASGSGSNAENIVHYFSNNEQVEIAIILTNKQDAYVVERAKRLGIECRYVPFSAWKDGREVLSIFKEKGIDFVVLAGFLLRIPSAIIDAYPYRIVNIHPSILPNYGGKGMYGEHVHKAVLAAQEERSGITIHYVNEHYDEGDFIAQCYCPVKKDDTPDTLAARVHRLEYDYFPVVIEKVLLSLISES